MIREAQERDAEEMERFLAHYPLTSMFLRSNLAAHGVENKTHRNGTQFFLQEESRLQGVFGITNSGWMMCQMPDATAEIWQGMASTLLGREVCGMTGDAEQVLAALGALNITEDMCGLFRTEPLYERKIAAIETDAMIRPAQDGDIAQLTDWFRAYVLETGTEQDDPDLRERCQERAQHAVTSGLVRLLIEGNEVTAMTGINASVKDSVQIGGVYTPPDLRGSGRAGRVILAHLAELRVKGFERAILFAASQDAARAYEKIGFQYRCEYHLALLKAPIVVQAPE